MLLPCFWPAKQGLFLSSPMSQKWRVYLCGGRGSGRGRGEREREWERQKAQGLFLHLYSFNAYWFIGIEDLLDLDTNYITSKHFFLKKLCRIIHSSIILYILKPQWIQYLKSEYNIMLICFHFKGETKTKQYSMEIFPIYRLLPVLTFLVPTKVR